MAKVSCWKFLIIFNMILVVSTKFDSFRFEQFALFQSLVCDIFFSFPDIIGIYSKGFNFCESTQWTMTENNSNSSTNSTSSHLSLATQQLLHTKKNGRKKKNGSPVKKNMNWLGSLLILTARLVEGVQRPLTPSELQGLQGLAPTFDAPAKVKPLSPNEILVLRTSIDL